VVRLAVMRGFGAGGHPYHQDLIACPSTGGGWSRHRSAADLGAVRDFDLLDVFLPKFGTRQRTELTRFCTGTPYGPFDIIPWDTPSVVLNHYRLIVMMGLFGMDTTQYTRLKTWVGQGGTLVCALGQFRVPAAAPRPFIRADLAVFPGAAPKKNGTPPPPVARTIDSPHAKDGRGVPKASVPLRVFDCIPGKGALPTATTLSGRPLILRVRYGRGQVLLFCTPFLADAGERIAATEIVGAAKPLKMLDWAPASNWLEYIVHRKGSSYVVAIFNHGRLRFPTGLGADHGIWKGTLTLRQGQWPGLDKNANFAAFAVNSTTFRLTPIALERARDGIQIHLQVDRFAEFVIGPAGSVQHDYFQ